MPIFIEVIYYEDFNEEVVTKQGGVNLTCCNI